MLKVGIPVEEAAHGSLEMSAEHGRRAVPRRFVPAKAARVFGLLEVWWRPTPREREDVMDSPALFFRTALRAFFLSSEALAATQAARALGSVGRDDIYSIAVSYERELGLPELEEDLVVMREVAINEQLVRKLLELSRSMAARLAADTGRDMARNADADALVASAEETVSAVEQAIDTANRGGWSP